MKKIKNAVTDFITRQPFFASLLLSMPLIEDTAVKTLSTNGSEIRYNPEFIESLSFDETVFVLGHELMHCVYQHMCRRGNKDHNKWNIATDYVINELLVNEKIGRMPKGLLYDPQLVKQGNGTAEGVYNAMGTQSPNPQQAPQQSNNGQAGQQQQGQAFPSAGEPGGSLDDMQDAAADDAGNSEKSAEMKVRVLQAANAARMHGKLSAGMSRLVGELTKPVVDWRAVLRRFLSEHAKTEYSFSKPKRRFLAEDIILPGLTGEKIGSIVVAVDCSGSINAHILNMFASEIKAIIEDVKPACVEVLYFDTKVLKRETFTQDDEIKLTPIGGGGTDFAPIFSYIEENDISPVACVILTDMYGPFGNSIPSFPVLWAATESEVNKIPFGEIVKMKEE